MSVKNRFLDSRFLSSGKTIMVKRGRLSGIGLIMATALENNGATVYIVGRRFEVVKRAAQENNVRFLPSLPYA